MAYTPHLKLQWGGTLLGGLEQWSNTLRFGLPSGLDVGADLTQEINDLDADIRAFLSDATMSWGGNATLDYVKFNRVDENDHYVNNPTVEVLHTPPIQYSSQSISHPSEISICVTLDTGKRGRRARGRFFLPPQNLPLSGDARLSTTQQQTVLTGVQTFLNNLNNWPGLDFGASQVAVASQFGDINPVTSIRVGRVFDVQRRRRRSLDEGYVSAPIS